MMWFVKAMSILYLLQMLKWVALVATVPGFPLMDTWLENEHAIIVIREVGERMVRL